MLTCDINNIRNQSNNWETCVSMKNEFKDFHENLSKFFKGTENLNLILLNQWSSLNKINHLVMALIIGRNWIVLPISALFVIILAT